MTTPQKKPTGPKLENPHELSTVYSNLARIAHSPADIVIDFAHMLPGEKTATVNARVLMTPLSAKLLLRALADNISRYEAAFGEIKMPVNSSLAEISSVHTSRRQKRKKKKKNNMHKLETIVDTIRQDFDALSAARDKALAKARQLTRTCSLAIRAVHRDDNTEMDAQLAEAHELAKTLTEDLKDHPQLFHAGYTQDALKEYVEAKNTCALIQNQPLQTPEELGVVNSTYLKGLSEVVGELRRRILDILRHGYSEEAERLLGYMDEIYAVLVTIDYPDAITYGLRRQTDIARSIIEKTRGDITFSLRGEHLEQAIERLSAELNGEQVKGQNEADK